MASAAGRVASRDGFELAEPIRWWVFVPVFVAALASLLSCERRSQNAALGASEAAPPDLERCVKDWMQHADPDFRFGGDCLEFTHVDPDDNEMKWVVRNRCLPGGRSNVAEQLDDAGIVLRGSYRLATLADEFIVSMDGEFVREREHEALMKILGGALGSESHTLPESILGRQIRFPPDRAAAFTMQASRQQRLFECLLRAPLDAGPPSVDDGSGNRRGHHSFLWSVSYSRRVPRDDLSYFGCRVFFEPIDGRAVFLHCGVSGPGSGRQEE